MSSSKTQLRVRIEELERKFNDSVDAVLAKIKRTPIYFKADIDAMTDLQKRVQILETKVFNRPEHLTPKWWARWLFEA